MKKKASKYALTDASNASTQDIAKSKVNGGSRKGQNQVRKDLIADEIKKSNGKLTCWRCGKTTTNPDNMHLGHTITPTSKGGNLDAVNVALEGAACNLSAGNSGYVKEGMSCFERGSCGAPYGRND